MEKSLTGIAFLLSLTATSSAIAADTVLKKAPKDPECIIRIVKNSCWDKYSVTAEVVRARSQQGVAKGTIEKADTQTDIKFKCPLGEPISVRATFAPAFWEGTENKNYMTKRIWDVPLRLPEKSDRWEIAACFPDDFQSVPIPPTGGLDCKCPDVKS